MTNEIPNPNDEALRSACDKHRIAFTGHWSFVRHSDLIIRHFTRALLFITTLSLTSCGTLQHYTEKLSHIARKKNKDDKKAATELLVGIIEMVNPEQRFVLIRTERSTNATTGTVLEARSATGGKSKLVVTPEKKMNFVSADIVDGFPQPGEMVILMTATSPVTSPAPPANANTAPPVEPTVKVPPRVINAAPGDPVPGVPPSELGALPPVIR